VGNIIVIQLPGVMHNLFRSYAIYSFHNYYFSCRTFRGQVKICRVRQKRVSFDWRIKRCSFPSASLTLMLQTAQYPQLQVIKNLCNGEFVSRDITDRIHCPPSAGFPLETLARFSGTFNHCTMKHYGGCIRTLLSFHPQEKNGKSSLLMRSK
jgi:hypothetical protein